jgi:hypothetical protein
MHRIHLPRLQCAAGAFAAALLLFDGEALVASGGALSRRPMTHTANTPQAAASGHITPGDFDGDGHTDLTIFRPSNQTWYTLSWSGTASTVVWGRAGDVPLFGDFDGDGRCDHAMFRPSDSTWAILRSTLGELTVSFGTPGVRPVPEDYDGDRRTDLAFYDPRTGEWHRRLSATGVEEVTAWGATTDIPVPADYDGDGRADLAVYRPSNGYWFIVDSSGGMRVVMWGGKTPENWSRSGGEGSDVPMPVDVNGDGRANPVVYSPRFGTFRVLLQRHPDGIHWDSYEIDFFDGEGVPFAGNFDGDYNSIELGVYRPSDGTWTSQNGPTVVRWGLPADVPAPADYDGDGRLDPAIFRHSGDWIVNTSSTSSVVTIPWGDERDAPVPGDYDGDGQADAAVYYWNRWRIRYSSGGEATTNLGWLGNVPVCADFDGDGRTDLAVLTSDFTRNWWYVAGSSIGPFTRELGAPGDVPARADYDGDGWEDVAMYRPATGVWQILTSGTAWLQTTEFTWGLPRDVPVARDYDGDGWDDIAVFRPSTGTWFLNRSTAGPVAINFGVEGDIPLPGDYDGDGKADLAVYRPSTARWFIFSSQTATVTTIALGDTHDVPVGGVRW